VTDAIDVPDAPPSGPALRYPARPVGTHWPATDLGRAEVRDLVLAAWDVYSRSHQQAGHVRGLGLLLDWLGEQPGTSWQERFIASGVDTMGAEWTTAPSEWLARTGDRSKRALEELSAALLRAIAADVVRPSFAWLLTAARNRRLAPLMGSVRDPAGFAELRAACEAGPHLIPEATRLVSSRVAVILAAKGGVTADVTIGDFLQLLDAETASRGKNRLAAADFKVLREMGIFGPGMPTLREIRSTGPRSTEELVDCYAIACRPVRDLLVEYLEERRTSLDYTTLARLAYALAGYGVLMGIVQIRFLPVYARLRFTAGFWAFTFSFAAVGTDAVEWIATEHPAGATVYSSLVVASLSVLVLAIAARSAVAIWRGQFFPPSSHVLPASQSAGQLDLVTAAVSGAGSARTDIPTTIQE